MTKASNSTSAPFSPHFVTPPVVETALSVQFTGLPEWTAVHPGLYYELIRDKYPHVRYEAPIPPIVETFPLAPKAPSFQFTTQPELGRVLFTAADGSSLLQLQQNRLVYNWKQANNSDRYPKFQANSEKFLEELSRFDSFCNAQDLGKAIPTYCEVLYVNHIFPKPGESIESLFNAVFTGVSIEPSTLDLETISYNRSYEIGKQKGRLYAEVGVVIEAISDPFLVFKLTSRMRHDEGSVSDTLRDAHDWLNKSFLELTREECRQHRWGQANVL